MMLYELLVVCIDICLSFLYCYPNWYCKNLIVLFIFGYYEFSIRYFFRLIKNSFKLIYPVANFIFSQFYFALIPKIFYTLFSVFLVCSFIETIGKFCLFVVLLFLYVFSIPIYVFYMYKDKCESINPNFVMFEVKVLILAYVFFLYKRHLAIEMVLFDLISKFRIWKIIINWISGKLNFSFKEKVCSLLGCDNRIRR